MSRKFPPPVYQDSLQIFIGELRDLLFSTQEQTAAFFHLDRSAISRYESGRTIPKIGYLAALAQLLAERRGNKPEIQQILLQEVNEAARLHYRQARFQNWAALRRVAEEYLNKQQTKRKARAVSKTPDPDKWRTLLESRLEPRTYTQLIGIEEHLDVLLDLLTASGPPWLISIEGIGGIGKTSLANALSRRIINRRLVDDFAWVSARQEFFNAGGGIRLKAPPALTVKDLVEALLRQLMPDFPKPTTFSFAEDLTALRSRLKQQRHLIVIDNLETVADIDNLLPTLRNLSNPTRFLLTTRESRPYEIGLYHFQLPELSKPNALRLIRFEARLRNLSHLAEADNDALARIVDVVGGNPLAIRLVAGQTCAHTLDAVLGDLTAARGQKVETLYTYIYRRIWDNLGEQTRRVLLAMPLVINRKDGMEHLLVLTRLTRTELRESVEELVTLNLVDGEGSLNNRRYTIHNLTRTFLHKQVARWQ